VPRSKPRKSSEVAWHLGSPPANTLTPDRAAPKLRGHPQWFLFVSEKVPWE